MEQCSYSELQSDSLTRSHSIKMLLLSLIAPLFLLCVFFMTLFFIYQQPPPSPPPAPLINSIFPTLMDFPNVQNDFPIVQMMPPLIYKIDHSNCGKIDATPRHGGTFRKAELFEFPWMVAILTKNENGEFKLHCGGSLISENIILTAASCIVDDM